MKKQYLSQHRPSPDFILNDGLGIFKFLSDAQRQQILSDLNADYEEQIDKIIDAHNRVNLDN